MKILMNKHIVIFGVISSLCFTIHSHTLEEVLTMLTSNQTFEHIKQQAYKTLHLYELHSLKPDTYFTQITKNRATLAKLACTTITLAYQQGLFTLTNEQEYTLLKNMYTRQVIALREAQLSLKLRIVKSICAENQSTLQDIYKNDQQHAYALLENLAERIYTEVIIPKIEDKELCVDQEFYITYKQAYKNAFILEKIKELENAYQ